MHRIASIALLCLFVSNVATAQVVRHGSLPEQYWGTWVGGAQRETDKSVIVLSAKSYVSRDASCSVNWVSQTASIRGSVYAAHLQCVNRAGTAGQKMTANLIIWPESLDRIAVGPEFMNLRSYRRCSTACPAIDDNHPSESKSIDKPRTTVGSGNEQ